MKQKKVNSLLKGVAGVGAALGGAAAFTDADVVYAAESENQSEKSEAPVIEELAAQSASQVVAISQANSGSAANSNSIVLSNSDSTSTLASTSDSIVDSNSEATSTSVSDSQSAVIKDSASASAVESGISSEVTSLNSDMASLSNESDSISAKQSEDITLSESASTYSEEQSTSLANSHSIAMSQYASASAELSTAVSEYNSQSMVFQENNYEDEYLEELIKQISEAQANVAAAKQTAIDDGISLNEAGYYTAADELANLLVQYSFYQEGYVGGIDYSDWVSTKHDNNYVKVGYDEDGEAYFDYVNSDADNENDGAPNADGKHIWENEAVDAENVDYITVVIKTPVYTSTSGNTLTCKTDEQGNLKYTLTVDGKKKDVSNVEKDKDGNYKVTYTETHMEGKWIWIGWRPVYKEVPVECTKTEVFEFNGQFFDKGELYFSEKDYNGGVDDYHKKREDLTSTEIKQSEAASTLKSTSESASLNSAYNSESVSKSASESVSDSTAKSTSLSESLKEFQSDSEEIAKKSESLKSNSESTSTSASNGASEAKSTSESTSTSASNSASEAKSNSESTSVSASESLSEANSLSTSNSISASNSASEAKSLSESTSTSVAESQSASTSLAESQSTSTSVAESQSTSTSVAESQSTSTSASTSTSTSESESASISASQSTSTSNNQPAGGNGGNGSATENNPVAPSESEDTTNIVDEDVPLTDGTDLIDDTDDADTSDTTDILDEDVPLAVVDEDELADIADEDVPLSDNPKTGDAMTATWIGTAATAVAGLFGAGRSKKKKDDNQK